MAGPLLETKFHVPRRGRGVVPRPRLIEGLTRRAESALTLVSAPAGFGKTTLLEPSGWQPLRPVNGRAAWLSLDPRDNDPALFWRYLVAALQTRGTRGRAERARAAAVVPAADRSGAGHAAQRPERRRRTTSSWCSTTTTSSRRPTCRTGWRSCWSTCPPQIHLVIASRADPALPLARLRARGELVEVRAADLRFTPEEAAAYLNEVMGLALTAQDVAALEGRTEGWIAALQLAALSMQGRDDVAGFIAGLRRRRPLHRRLPGRGGPAASARAGPELPAADLDPRAG